MPTLAELYRDKVKSHKDPRMKTEGEFDIQYPSGFLALDFANGSRIEVHPNDGSAPFSYYSVGIMDGAAMELVGRPGCGKTTLGIQIAASIVEKFEWSSFFHDDGIEMPVLLLRTSMSLSLLSKILSWPIKRISCTTLEYMTSMGIRYTRCNQMSISWTLLLFSFPRNSLKRKNSLGL